MNRPTILFTARDPGGAGAVIPVCQYFQKKNIEVVVAASGVALDMMRSQNINAIPFKLANQKDHICQDDDPAQLLSAAEKLLLDTLPNAVVTAISSFGAGLDEAIIARADVPTYTIQDCWGDVNMTLGITAETYFVMDEFAANISYERFGVNAIIAGAPKYASYTKLDIPILRSKHRNLVGVDENVKLVCWIGQSSDVPGHDDVLNDFIASVSGLGVDMQIVLRGHPKFPASFDKHISRLHSVGFNAIDITGQGAIEGWLAACDLLVTPFSMCGVDHAYLSSLSPDVLGNVVYCMTNKQIRHFQFQNTGMKRFPPLLDKGMGFYEENRENLSLVFKQAITLESRNNYHMLTKKIQTKNPCELIYKYIVDKI